MKREGYGHIQAECANTWSNEDLRIQCMKREGYRHIQAKSTNTWSDDEFEACNEVEDICNESIAQVSLSPS